MLYFLFDLYIYVLKYKFFLRFRFTVLSRNLANNILANRKKRCGIRACRSPKLRDPCRIFMEETLNGNSVYTTCRPTRKLRKKVKRDTESAAYSTPAILLQSLGRSRITIIHYFNIYCPIILRPPVSIRREYGSNL